MGPWLQLFIFNKNGESPFEGLLGGPCSLLKLPCVLMFPQFFRNESSGLPYGSPNVPDKNHFEPFFIFSVKRLCSTAQALQIETISVFKLSEGGCAEEGTSELTAASLWLIARVLFPCSLKIGSCSLVPFDILPMFPCSPNQWETLI